MHTRAVLKTLLMSGALALASLASSNAFAEEINVGANIGNVPWEFQDARGKTVGFEIDLMTEVGKRLGMDVKFTNIPFAGPVRRRPVRPDRRRRIVDHHHQEAAGVGQLRAALLRQRPVADRQGRQRHHGLAGMEGKIVGVDTGSTGDMWATAHQGETKIAHDQQI